MLTANSESLEKMEVLYPGIKGQIEHFENAELPSCKLCGSADTASTQVGVIGRSIHIAGATTKFHLRPNDKPGNYFCNKCRKYFDDKKPNKLQNGGGRVSVKV